MMMDFKKAQALSQFVRQKSEVESHGGHPVVCIAGNHDYDELIGECQAFANVFSKKPIILQRLEPITIMGVKVYRCPGKQYGFYFGEVES
jgi:DNA repair exonuclease SbcCD nuclease subunit